MFGRKSVVKDLNPGLDYNRRSSRKRKRNLEDEGLETETKRVNRGESTSDQVEAGPSNSEQVEAGPSRSEQVEAGPSNTGQGLTGPANIGQGLTAPSNTGQGLTGPANTGQGLTDPANTGQGLTGPANTGQGLTDPANTDLDLTDPANTGLDLTDPANIGRSLIGPLGERLTGPADAEQRIARLLQRGVFVWDSLLGRPRGTRFGPMQPVPGVRTLPIARPPANEPWVGRDIPGTRILTPQSPGPIEAPSLVNTPGSSPPEDKIPEGESLPPGDGADDMDIF